MFNRTFYILQGKKLFWLSTMIGLAAFTFLNATLAPASLIGLGLGLGAFHLLPLLPNAAAGLMLLASPFLILLTPYALAFNASFIGLIVSRMMDNSKMSDALKQTHTMGCAEQEDFDLMIKLQRKTKIKVSNLKVCDVDAKTFSPNAAAAGGFINNTIYVFSNIMREPFTRKERKAIYAHEFGHLKHWDSITQSATSFLWYSIVTLSLASLSFPVAFALCSLASISYYSVSQADELLADWHSAQYTNPKNLISALDKLINYSNNLENPKKDDGLWHKSKTSFHAFKKRVGLITHPTCSVRKSYLAGYVKEIEDKGKYHSAKA